MKLSTLVDDCNLKIRQRLLINKGFPADKLTAANTLTQKHTQTQVIGYHYYNYILALSNAIKYKQKKTTEPLLVTHNSLDGNKNVSKTNERESNSMFSLSRIIFHLI